MCIGDQVGKHPATELHLSLSILFYRNADEARGESMCLAVISIQSCVVLKASVEYRNPDEEGVRTAHFRVVSATMGLHGKLLITT